jgi:Glyoxalase/Bleomycin resistance protein/Dioxygenase superfamily
LDRGGESNEAHLDDHRGGRRPGQLQNGIGRCSVSLLTFLPMKTLGRFSIQIELSCSASTSVSPDHARPGNGLLLFFLVDDFDLALQRARTLVTRIEEEPHVNPNTQTKEFSLRDPDGYYVTISALSAA